jgi:hypothetical protein
VRISSSKFREMLNEEARRVMSEDFGSAMLGTAAGSAAAAGGAALAPAAALGYGVYRGASNVSARSAGMQGSLAKTPAETELENNIRAVFYGKGKLTTFFNMTADAGMFFKDLYTGDGGDFGDLSDAAKAEIVKQTYEAVKSKSLTADKFYEIVKGQFLKELGDENPPQKVADNMAEGTDTYFQMLDQIQQKWAGGQTPAQQQEKAQAASGVGAANVAAVKAFQTLVGANPDGVWRSKTNEQFLAVIQGAKIMNAQGQPIDPKQLATNWMKFSPLIASVNGAAKKYTPNIAGATQLVNDVKGAAAAPAPVVTPQVPGSPGVVGPPPVAESVRRVKIAWGR